MERERRKHDRGSNSLVEDDNSASVGMAAAAVASA